MVIPPTGTVPRDGLVKRLLDLDATQLVVVTAPCGYGKTTAVELWDQADERPFAWVHLDQRDDDVARLHGRVDHAVRGLQEPLVLVLDDIHAIMSNEARGYLEVLVAQRTPSRQVVLVGRCAPYVSVARQVTAEPAVEVSGADLAMDENEAAVLLDHLGVRLTDDRLEELMARTEGWPVGLRLARLAPSGDDRDTPEDISGRVRLVTDYFAQEVLEGLPHDQVGFLERSATLDRMDAALLDELLGLDDSALRLETMEASGNLFMVPLDEERQQFRYHHLFAETLRCRLQRRDPALASDLHRRASLVLERRCDIGGAIRHAMAADDVHRAADLVLARTMDLVNTGCIDRLGAWLALIGRDAIDRSAAAAVAWGWYGEATGNIDLLKRAVTAAERSTHEGRLVDGSPSVEVAVAILRAMEGWEGLEGVIRDSRVARGAGGPSLNPWWTIATVLEGTALSMRGDLDLARDRFYEALHVMNGAPALEAATRAHLAVIALEEDDLVEAERFSARAAELMERYGLSDVLPTVAVPPTIALVRARCGRPDDARRMITTGADMAARLDYLSPRAALNAYVLLARAACTVGEVDRARGFMKEAERARRNEPSANRLNDHLDELRARLAVGTGAAGAVSITPAEWRVLERLPTHLSLQEIADRLIISRNTAKSHAGAIYRKLGVSSRSEAVAEARRRGLLSGGAEVERGPIGRRRVRPIGAQVDAST